MKPMLACSDVPTPEQLRFPLLASYKIDGFRCYVKNGVATSRSGKPIRNIYTQEVLGKAVLDGLDGELAVGNPWDKNLMQQTSSGMNSISGEPNFKWFVFDVWSYPSTPFEQRVAMINPEREMPYYVRGLMELGHLEFLQQVKVNNHDELLQFEAKALSIGYEGLIVRDPSGPYKHGRSTMREGWMLKIKRWKTSEARVTGFKERMHNANEAFKDELGFTKRSSHQANMIPDNTLGTLTGVDVVTGQEVNAGTGFDDALRAKIWANRDAYIGKLFTYKHFAQTGVKDGIRHGVFKAFRAPEDM